MKEIPLSGQKGEGKFALVDDNDFETTAAYSWYLSNKSGYATTRRIFLHSFILGDSPPGFSVDHIDGNRLNNQRSNLRWATCSQNAYNTSSHKDSTSQFKGVFWDSKNRLWRADIQFDKKTIRLGSFASEFDAARAYNAAATQYHGEYARLNIIPDATEPVRYRQALNHANGCSSQYRGVCFPAKAKRWVAQIQVLGKTIRLGFFDTEEAAARAYDAAAKLHRGDRAFLNFPAVKEACE